MRLALDLAKKGIGRTSPNPCVGAVIVKAGRVIGSGWHRKAGLPHAEIEAIRDAGSSVKGADIYVTLEPCNHFGKTPPCSDAIIRAGIKRVFVGASDSNPKVSGSGIKKLRRTGIKVITNVLSEECALINEAYNKYIKNKTPYVLLKLAMSADGKIAGRGGREIAISSLESRKFVHKLRSELDCVLVGVGTVLKDNPQLNVRLVKGRSPKKAVLDRDLKTPLNANVLKGEKCFIFTSVRAARSKKAVALAKKGAEVVGVPLVSKGLSLKHALKELGERGIVSVLIEGGAKVATSVVKERLADKVMFFIAPMVVGKDGVDAFWGMGFAESLNIFREFSVNTIGSDLMIEGRI